MAPTSQRTVILFGAHRWRHGRYVDDALAAGLRVVLAQPSRDRERISRSLKARVHGVFRMPPEDRPGRTRLPPAASLPPSLLPELQSAVERLLKEMGVWYGLSHWEFIVTPDARLALVESQMRPGGDRIMELVEYATGEPAAGIHPVRALLDWLAGKKFEPSRFRPARSAAICFLAPARSVGRVRDVEIDPELGSHCREPRGASAS